MGERYAKSCPVQVLLFSRVRIGVVTTSYPRFPGDPAGTFVAGLNRYLHTLGHQVQVVAAGELGAAETSLSEAGIAVSRVPSALFYHGGAPDALSLGRIGEAGRFSLALRSRCRERLRGCQALISHWLVPCGLIGALCAAGRPHLMIAHSSDVHLLRRWQGEALVRWLARRGDLVYTASSLVVAGAPGRVVPMGVDAAAFAEGARGERQAARERLGVVRPTLLFLGRLVPVKGVDRLLAALALPAARGWDLQVAGDGPDRERLMNLAAALGDRVRFLGEVRGDARRHLLLAADVLCLPSVRLADGRTEGAPTVLLEAMCAGCPVVASDVGGVAALVGGAGRLCPPGDVAALAEALGAALDPGWRGRMRDLARTQGARHDWSEIGPALLGSWPGT